MAEQVLKLSAIGRTMLTVAATREDRLVRPPQLPIAAARQVVRSLLNHSLVEEVPAAIGDPADAWRTAEDGTVLALRATSQGLMAVGGAADSAPEPSASESADLTSSGDAFTQIGSAQGQQPLVNEDEALTVVGDLAAHASTQPETATESPAAPHTAVSNATASNTTANTETRPDASQPPARANLRQAAQALLEVWSNGASRAPALDQSMVALRLALDERAPRITTAEPRKPRENTKQAQVLALLRRLEGATVAQIAEAMGWAPHTVRGFFAGLKTRHGMTVEAAERVRQVGPNQQGAKGSYTVYRIAEAG